ncbi:MULTISPECIES: SIMPL domain-containing protein [unclassified Agrococcus]|uniref:SIMPL domain-containing protein n=1 Tax=unclassified Agrococcus TaxID=2615065 RepID=UPI00361B3A25
MTQIIVSGTGIQRAPAERASVVVSTQHRAAHPEEAIRVVAEAHATIAAQARGFVEGGQAERWHADRVWVSHHEQWVGDGKRRDLVFDAAASVHVTFVDFEALGTWIGAVATMPVHQVGGIQWSLSDATEHELGSTARADAIADAQRKAADFAAAAGLATPRIASIQEAGLAEAPTFKARPMATGMRAGAAAPEPSLDLQGSDIEVTSEVRVELEA